MKGRGGLEKIFKFYALLATRFLCLYATVQHEQHAVMIANVLQRLRRRLFTYLSYKLSHPVLTCFAARFLA